MSDDSPDDAAELFRSAMKNVQLKRDKGRISQARPPPTPVPRQLLADEAEVLREMIEGPDPEWFETGETLQYAAPGIQQRVLRQLQKGHFRVDDEIDLHGLNRTRARQAVAAFLIEARNRDFRCIRIIHGKGHGSPNSGPVLKRQVDIWLRKIRDVAAFCSARPNDGGSGAVYVLLTRPRH